MPRRDDDDQTAKSRPSTGAADAGPRARRRADLAQALRENLKRRKAAARRNAASDDADAPAPEAQDTDKLG